ncbi:phage major capsid protein [Kineococcus sp. G2]|uniref:phage major capsid protein n=1 Tax=Kineococcus sp. G2 TaxID=3127484 RepID=UPI00301DCBC1
MPTALTTTPTVGVPITPPDQAGLVIGPLQRDSLALRTATVIATRRDEVRVPLLTDDVPADFVEEGAELPEGQPFVAEVALRPAKLAALTVLSNELASDSEPGAVNLVGESIARSIRARLDSAFLDAPGTGIPPAGVLTSANSTDGGTLGVDTGSLDTLQDALTLVEAAGGTPNVIVCHPSTWGVLAKLKAGDGSAVPLLGSPSDGRQERTVFGVPVFVDAQVPEDIIGVWDRAAVAVALRQDVSIEQSRDAYFSSDSVAVRATLRAAWDVLDPERVVRIAVGTPVAP